MVSTSKANAERARLLKQKREERAKLRAEHLAQLPPLRYTIPEAAKMLRKSVAGTYNAIKEGRLKVVKDGRRSYITPAETQRYVAACEQASSSASAPS